MQARALWKLQSGFSGHHRLHSGNRRRCRRLHSSSSSHVPPWPQNPSPTPYEVLGVDPARPYTKENFSRLVKIYHPDQVHHSTLENISADVRLRRFLLILAANELLGHPQKHKLYRSHRLGWNGGGGPRHATHSYQGSHSPGACSRDHSRTSWTPPPPPPRTSSQSPLYVSNCIFAVAVVALAMLGSIALQHLARESRQRQRRAEVLLHNLIARELDAMSAFASGTSRDDRVLAFLARRQASVGKGEESPMAWFERDLELNICRH
ncbi:hypothetical protein NLU13_1164 [Sarocladium strictum]|uniref:J domain-containing protein n=1 Tax=Sarocladium strictum TaxID=5046 RepID=A0AA39GQG1_SARSR|nr:hypothetical protein NLU13_1164 [Sarocladium strictum]